jgi:hypothetical protein
MKQNVGETDQKIRFVAAGALLAAAWVGRLSWPLRVLSLVVGAGGLLSATTRHCPVNSFLRVDTNRESNAPEGQFASIPGRDTAASEAAIQQLAE